MHIVNRWLKFSQTCLLTYKASTCGKWGQSNQSLFYKQLDNKWKLLQGLKLNLHYVTSVTGTHGGSTESWLASSRPLKKHRECRRKPARVAKWLRAGDVLSRFVHIWDMKQTVNSTEVSKDFSAGAPSQFSPKLKPSLKVWASGKVTIWQLSSHNQPC